MKAFRSLALVGLFVVLAGCKHEPSVVGDWSCSVGGASLTFTFGADHSLKLIQAVPQLGPITLKGTYEQETADTLTLKFTSAEYKATGTPQIDGAIEQGVNEMKSKPANFKMVWKGEKEIDLTPTSAPANINVNLVLTRK